MPMPLTMRAEASTETSAANHPRSARSGSHANFFKGLHFFSSIGIPQLPVDILDHSQAFYMLTL